MENPELRITSADEGKTINVMIGKNPTPLVEQATRHENLTIESVVAFALRHKEITESSTALREGLAVANRNELTLRFCTNPRHQLNDLVLGKCTLSKELTAVQTDFRINAESGYFSQDELRKLIRRSKHLFSDGKEWGEVLHTLENISAKIETFIKSANDSKGNTEETRKQQLKFIGDYNDTPKQFTLFLPIISGVAAKTHIQVEIVAEVIGGAVKWRLENWMLQTIIIEATDRYFDEQIAILTEAGYLVVEQQ